MTQPNPTGHRKTTNCTFLPLFLAAIFSAALPACGGSKPAAPETAGEFAFTATDAARLLGVPADTITATVQQQYAGFWLYSFTAAEGGKNLSFSVTISKSVEQAAADLEQYRGSLETAAETGPFKDKLPNGAYSDINIGDEAIWTDINGTLTVRKGKISIQIQSPSGKMEQIKAAQALLEKF